MKNSLEAAIRAQIDDAVHFAEHSPIPDGMTVADYVFAPDGPIAIVGEPGATDRRYINAYDSRTGQPFDVVRKAEEAVGNL